VNVRKEIRITGIVQGVGFRPYVFRLAADRRLAGNVCNTSSGITIEIQGPRESVEDFLRLLPQNPPVLAQISGMTVSEIPCASDAPFEILPSHAEDHADTVISPDVAVCPDCLRELFDPRDRRFCYPFINCTNCGPRFSIVRGIPYDRALTSMSVFPLCADCRAEFDDPFNRRFHAQPNACWKCGPRLELWNSDGQPIECAGPIAAVVENLRRGQIAAIKGLGGFHLAVDATNESAVERLRQRKRRIEKPFAVMVADLAAARSLCEIEPEDAALLESRERPIVLLPRRPESSIARSVAPGHAELGIFLPYTPVHHLLFRDANFPALVMTSANLSEEPIAIRNCEAVARLGRIADCFLVHDREILLRCDDSVVRRSAGKLRRLRRSRGYVPAPLSLHKNLPQILAVGGELKNTVSFTRGNLAFLSQHIGDLENAETFDFFREAIAHLQQIFEISPAIIAHDLHPDYLSTKWALAQKSLPLAAVQHHHAHIASCMAENSLEGRVIGVALDGSGYGPDGCVWGGEVLVAGYESYLRAGHFSYVSLAGGEAAVREPWRVAVSYLRQAFGPDFVNLDIPFVRGLNGRKLDLLFRMIDRRINSPLTSSCGRLFDAVSALVGLRREVSYEAQAAIELEMAARESCDSASYPFSILRKEGPWQIDWTPLMHAIVQDIRSNVSIGTISRRFHSGLADAVKGLAFILREEWSLNRVCLTGGSFQNVVLSQSVEAKLRQEGFEVFTHSIVPAGDGGLSLGQALVAAHSNLV